MRHIPGAWRRAARGASLLGSDGVPAPTIFAEMTGLAVRTGAINLGQGFPDEDGPQEVLEAAISAISAGANQYAPGRGVPVLLDAIGAHQRRFRGIELDPQREVLVTAGATEALAATLLALIDSPDDEVVVFEPYYDSYAACIALAGARLVPVPLRYPDFQPDLDELARAVTDRTRLILVNDPHNPTGAVFSSEVRAEVVRLAQRHDALIVTDEVYEHLVFDGRHEPIAAMPGAAERTLSISSAGKTFSTTGWKIGWVTGPADLIDAVLAVKQFLTYVNGTPFQHAIAVGLGFSDEFFAQAAATLRAKRDLLGDGLRAAGFTVSVAAGSYFTVADAAPFLEPGQDGADLCRALPERVGVAAIPLTAFVSPDHRGQYASLVRFAACKRTEVIAEASARLATLGG
ncbi:MAG: aminotransferase class I/II-fold pyridoxal phosphate-dependent enzyme [Microbacterium sp.]